jgi:hypothetical protein
MLQDDEASQIYIYYTHMHFRGIRIEDMESIVLTLDRDHNVHLHSIKGKEFLDGISNYYLRKDVADGVTLCGICSTVFL